LTSSTFVVFLASTVDGLKNIGGRGRYRTADRWCVKPELYH
jgi:hypothetical protein